MDTLAVPAETWEAYLRFAGPRAIPGVEEVREGTYRRTIRHRGAAGVLTVAPARERAAVRLAVSGLGLDALETARRAVCRMLDLDADTAAIDRALAADRVLAPLVAARPGLRAPGAYDGWELAVRAIVGQQVSVGAATTLAGRVVRAVGTPLERPVGSLTHAFPLPRELAAASLPGIGMPGRRVETLRGLGAALVTGTVALDGELHLDASAGRPGRLPDRRCRTASCGRTPGTTW